MTVIGDNCSVHVVILRRSRRILPHCRNQTINWDSSSLCSSEWLDVDGCILRTMERSERLRPSAVIFGGELSFTWVWDDSVILCHSEEVRSATKNLTLCFACWYILSVRPLFCTERLWTTVELTFFSSARSFGFLDWYSQGHSFRLWLKFIGF